MTNTKSMNNLCNYSQQDQDKDVLVFPPYINVYTKVEIQMLSIA